jgi:hypothetical protein
VSHGLLDHIRTPHQLVSLHARACACMDVWACVGVCERV